MNGEVTMFFYEQSLLIKMKQNEIEAGARNAWKWNKDQNKRMTKQMKNENTNSIPQVCCQA
jgi:hypothetical protein